MDAGPLIHAGAGLALGALSNWLLPDWAGIPIVAVVGLAGWLREKLQHPPFRDPLSWWQRLEAAAWCIGASGGWLLASLT